MKNVKVCLIVAAIFFLTGGVYAYKDDNEKTAIEMFSEQFTENLGKAAEYAMEATKLTTQFNVEIATARAKFLEKPDDKKRAKEFVDKLNSKDMAYMWWYVMEGTSDYSKKRVDAMSRISGGGLDGGIHPGAMRDFMRWIDGLREDLGARNDKDLPPKMVLNDREALARALDNRRTLYAKYVATRNSIELEPIEKVRIATQIKKDIQTGILPTLHKQELFFANSQLRGSRALAALYFEAYKTTGAYPQVLVCTYGPVYRRSGDTVDRYQRYMVWYKAAPSNFEQWKAADEAQALLTLGGQAAAESCPSSIRDGELLWRRGRDAYAGNSFEYTYGGPR